MFDAQHAACVQFGDSMHVVVLAGALDRASREATIRACTLTDHVHVVVAMAEVTFMDCAGYGALIVASVALRRRGGSLSLLDPAGEPLRLLLLIEQLEGEPSLLLRRTTSHPSPVLTTPPRGMQPSGLTQLPVWRNSSKTISTPLADRYHIPN